MIIFNLRLPQLHSEPFLHATSSQVGTWLFLVAYCCEQENNGRIANCKNWSPATWIKVTGSETPGDVCPLWKWTRTDLLLEFYPLRDQIAAQDRRVRCKAAALKRWGRNPDAFTEAGPVIIHAR